MMTKPETKSAKTHHVFPAPEWTALSATLAATLAHEIRNPLLAITGAAQLLEQSVSDEDKPLAQLIISEAKRIAQLVATMDPLTPNPAQVAGPINIHEVTEYVRVAASSFAPGVRFITDYDPSLPPVLGVREPLVQALMNLVKNAVEASLARHPGLVPGSPADKAPSEGDPGIAKANRDDGLSPTITLRTRYLVGERMRRTGGTTLAIQLSVSDNGPGVEAALMPRLFTPFSSGKAGGSGLGLAIVAKIIEEHGGVVACEGQPGSGAVFSLYLPMA